MTVGYMREKISSVYPGPKWTERVKWMPDNQVIAIYYKFVESGKFDKKVKEEPKKETYIQMSIWDILGGMK